VLVLPGMGVSNRAFVAKHVAPLLRIQ
jgi:hypothetical protein